MGHISSPARSLAARNGRRARLSAIALIALAGGCGRVEDAIRDALAPERTAHERYADALVAAGLDSSALGRDWIAAGALGLGAPVDITVPFRERTFFNPAEPRAAGYRVVLKRGQQLHVGIDPDESMPGTLFADLFRIDRDTTRAPERVAGPDSSGMRLDYEARRDGSFVVRLQPELLRGGAVTVTIVVGPSIAFPVHGKNTGAIRSGFGAARDAGTRSHHGVDIFAPRGTPALAGATGTVRTVEITPIGGKVVWISDRQRGQTLYYAHLDSQVVRRGDSVRVGDTVGFVGNTGNARTTPPHLHFGVYRRGEGPVDPYPFIHQPQAEASKITADQTLVGEWIRIVRPRAVLRAAPMERSETVDTLERFTPLRVESATGGWYRARLPNDVMGYLPASAAEPVARALRTTQIDEPLELRMLPAAASGAIAAMHAGESLHVLGRFNDFELVRGNGGRLGWVSARNRDPIPNPRSPDP